MVDLVRVRVRVQVRVRVRARVRVRVGVGVGARVRVRGRVVDSEGHVHAALGLIVYARDEDLVGSTWYVVSE